MTEQPPKPRRGCFFYGCITCLVLAAIVLGALLVGFHYVKKMVNQFTDAQPMELPTVQMSQGEIDKLKQRFQAFEEAVRDKQPTAPLALTSDDVNALIASGQGREILKGKVYVSLDGDQVKGQISLPLEMFGLTMFKGRYLNGNGSFGVSFQNGVLAVAPQEIMVKGKPLPEKYLEGIRKENLAANFTREPAVAAVLQGLEGIQVKDGKLTLVPKEKK